MKVMLDLETLGTDPGCAILEIALYTSDGRCYYARPTLDDQLQAGLWIDPDTLRFWSKQPTFSKLMTAEGQVPAAVALMKLSTWLRNQGEFSEDPIELWACGEDWSWLKAAFQAYNIPLPWKYNQVRDYRTIRDTLDPHGQVSLSRDMVQFPLHDALSDARYQLYNLEHLLDGVAPMQEYKDAIAINHALRAEAGQRAERQVATDSTLLEDK